MVELKGKKYPQRNRRLLTSTTMGEESADLVLRNSTLISVYSGELIEDIDVTIKGNRIAFVGDSDHAVGGGTKIIDLNGRFLSPGFLDAHVHIEDCMGTVVEFARVVLFRGTTGVFIDPHEMANVLGMEGIKLMMEEARDVPLRVYVTIPSCVPSTSPDFETSGAQIGVDDVKKALKWDGIVGLGEMMNYSSLVTGKDEPHAMIEETLKAGKVVEGHFPSEDSKKLNAYISAGASSCHESTKKSEALEKIRLGMHLMIRGGFASLRNLSELIRVVTEENIDTGRISLVTDDRYPGDLLIGHMDHVVRKAIHEGVDPVEAIQMATINTAKHFRLDDLIGGLAPGRFADMVVLDDLSEVEVNEVIVDGKIIAKGGKLLVELGPFKYPQEARKTLHIPKLMSEKFKVESPHGRDVVEARVIGVDEKSPTTKSLTRELEVDGGLVQADAEGDVAKIAVVERHGRTGNIGLGFVEGFGFEEGATASTISHDTHNLMVIGIDDRDMAFAANTLAGIGGGMAVVTNKKILGLVELPIAGLMANHPLKETHKKMNKLSKALNKLGCKMKFPFPIMSLLALPVLPELRITDKGLINTIASEKVDLLKE